MSHPYLHYISILRPSDRAVALDKPPLDRDQAGFMVFDTILAFDHVKHRILAIANARIRQGEDLRTLYDFACAKIELLEREDRKRTRLNYSHGYISYDVF